MNSEVTRVSGTSFAGNPKQAISEITDRMMEIEITPYMLREMETFEDVMVALYVLKFQLMRKKQMDYGPGNIQKNGIRGIMTRAQDKLERIKTLVGEPEQQVEAIKNLLGQLPDDARYDEMDQFAAAVSRIVEPQTAVKDESLDDTLMDWGNYGDIGYILHMGAWGKEMK